MIGPYDTPQAFRVALEARLRNVSQTRGTDLQRLQRRVSFDRLLARLFRLDDPPWLLKGGCALELRLSEKARTTLDIDISVPDPSRLRLVATMGEDSPTTHTAYLCLQQAASYDLGDGFEFIVHAPRAELTGAPAGGIRCSVEARLAGRLFARFHLDVGLGDRVLDEPDWAEGSNLLAFAGISPARVALYPLAQQFAEKVHAYTFPWQDRDNTRVKDLVDMVLLVRYGLPAPDRIRRALEATFSARHARSLPERLPLPPADWAKPYEALASELGLPATTLQEAYDYLDEYWQRCELGESSRPEQ